MTVGRLGKENTENLNQTHMKATTETAQSTAQADQAAIQKRSWTIAFLLGMAAALGLPTEVIAQVNPASDGIGTRVIQQGDRFVIDGGTRSADGQNLFHSLQEFGLSADEIATFMSSPDIQNILSRVVGGEASFIDGLIEVAGGNSNLFLINPAGIIFGSNAQLNVPADFTATTATGIGFEDGWFDAFGEAGSDSDWVGDPTGFRFATANPGAIANAGELAVGSGQSLTLLGGTVINTGTLSAPGGSLTVAAVPGESLVRISHEGMVLNLEVDSLAELDPTDAGAEALPFTPLSLPNLLTGSNAENATDIEVNPDGTVNLRGSGLAIPAEPGTAIASGSLSARSNNSSGTLPQVAVVGDRVAVLDGRVNASAVSEGGLIRIGGNFQGQGTPGQGTIFNSQMTYVDEASSLRADGTGAIAEGGQVIIWSDGSTQFAGAASARAGNAGGDGGLIEVSGRDNLTYTGVADTAAPNGTDGLLLLDPTDITIVDGEGNATPDLLFEDGPDDAFVDAGAINASVGDVILQANRDISVEAEISTDSVDNLILQAGRNISIFADITLGGGNFLARINDEGANPATRDVGLATFSVDDSEINTIDGDITIEVGTFGGLPEGGINVSETLSATNGDISITDFSELSAFTAALLAVGGDITLESRTVAGNRDGKVRMSDTILDADGDVAIAGGGTTLNDSFLASQGVFLESSLIEGESISIRGSIAGEVFEGVPTAGVRLEGSVIRGEGGDVLIEGVRQVPASLTNSVGVYIGTSEMTNEGDGDLEIIGTSQVNVGDGAGNHGVLITDDNLLELTPGANLLSVEDGTLSISGTTQAGNGFSNGIQLDGITLDAGANGEILLQGEAASAVGILADGSQINVGADSSRIALTADEIDLTNESIVTGSGELLIQPLTASADIQIGGAVDEELDDISDDDRLTLNTEDLASLENGFSQVIIGRDNSSGLITVDETEGDIVFQDPTLLRSPTGAGAIDTTGGTLFAVDEAILDLLANQDIITADIVAPGGELSLTSLSGSINTTNGVLNVDDVLGGGNVTLNAAQNVTTGEITANAEIIDSIVEDLGDGGTVEITAGQDVRLDGVVEAESRAVSPSVIDSGNGGTVRVESGGDIVANQSISVASSTTNGNAGSAGQVELSSDSTVQIDSAIDAASVAELGDAGNGGEIRINAGSDLGVNADLTVSSRTDTGNAGSAGQIELNAPGTVQLNASLNADSTASDGSAGDGGDIRATAGADVIVAEAMSASSRSPQQDAASGGRIELIGDRNVQIGSEITVESEASGSTSNGGVLRAEAGEDLIVSDRLSTSSLATSGSAGNAGQMDLLAGNSIQLQGPIEAESQAGTTSGNGGSLRVEAGNSVEANAGLSTATQAQTGNSGLGGRIEIRAGQDLSLDAGANASSRAGEASGNGGVIRLDAEGDLGVQGTLNSSTDSSGGTTGNGGRLRITANGDIDLDNIDTSAAAGSVGGDIRVNSRDGSIRVNSVISADGVGDRVGGQTVFRSETGVTLNLTPVALSGSDVPDDPTLSTGGQRFVANTNGTVRINGQGDVPVRIATLGGTLRLRGDAINVDNVILDSSVNTAAGGTIRLLSPEGPIAVGNLNSSGETGGDIFVRSGVAITAGEINSSGSLGDGGDVTLDPPGDVEVSFINAQGGSEGTGGSVDITTESFFRATDTFPDRNDQPASISTIGGVSGGDITIRHGGNGETPFDVGDGRVNGTAGAITSGDFSIEPFESFPFTFILGNIRILTGGSPPVEEPPPVEPPSELDTDLNNPDPDSPDLDIDLDAPLVTLVPSTFDYETIETVTTDEFINYWGLPNPPVPVTIDEAQDGLREIEQETGVKPAILYAFFVPAPVSLRGVEPLNPGANLETNSEAGLGERSAQSQSYEPSSIDEAESSPASDYLVASLPSDATDAASSRSDVWIPVLGDGSDLSSIDALIAQAYLEREPEETDELELILVTSDRVVRRRLSTATRAEVQAEADRLRSQVTNPIRSNRYLPHSQALYDWLVRPLEAELEQQQVDNIAFVMDVGLRSVPIAALHDGDQFIIQNYSVGLMPTLSLTDTRYADIRAMDVLAMGAAEFTNFPDLSPLPAVPVELEAITQDIWEGVAFIDNGFSIPNLLDQRRDRPYGIVHLATHGEFQPGEPVNSFIQFGQERLRLSQLRDLSLNDPPVELLVLSACRTALGDEEAELGFAGLAVQAGVKSALASLWYVSDTGTLAVMTQFYQELQEAPIKAEALRQAQLDLLNGENRWVDSVRADAAESGMTVADELFDVSPEQLSHPYFWSAFTMIGSPW